MKYENIDDIYTANERYAADFRKVVEGVSAAEAEAVPKDEKWSIKQLVEHVSTVETGAAAICAKLLAQAKNANKASDGGFSISQAFGEGLAGLATQKLEAPTQVQPTGEVPIQEALGRMSAAADKMESMRADLKAFALDGHTFPHPYLGRLTAAEWFAIAGLHAGRHTNQIQTLIAKLRQ